MRSSSNPAMRNNVFANARSSGASGSMTLQGTVNKTGILLAIVVLAAAFNWLQFSKGNVGLTNTLMMVGLFGGLVTYFITYFKPQLVPNTSLIYAVFEGLLLGGLSAFFEARYPGLVIQAVGMTFATLFVMLAMYKSGTIRVTDKFKSIMFSMLGAVFIFYIGSLLLSLLFGFQNPLLGGGGIMAIGFSLFVSGLAAFTLLLDFDMIEQGVSYGAPKYMEWYGAFSLLVTLVWLYIELLRLLSYFQGRD